MMENIIPFSGITKLDTSPDIVLSAALGHLESVVIVGHAKDGSEYFVSSLADGGDALWLLERCKFKLMQIGGGEF